MLFARSYPLNCSIRFRGLLDLARVGRSIFLTGRCDDYEGLVLREVYDPKQMGHQLRMRAARLALALALIGAQIQDDTKLARARTLPHKIHLPSIHLLLILMLLMALEFKHQLPCGHPIGCQLYNSLTHTNPLINEWLKLPCSQLFCGDLRCLMTLIMRFLKA